MKPKTEPLQGWHRADIIAAVRKKGSSLARLGRSIGLSRPSMSWALIKPHPRANAAIAELIETPMHKLWPQWFRPPEGARHGSAKIAPVSGQKSTPHKKAA